MLKSAAALGTSSHLWMYEERIVGWDLEHWFIPVSKLRSAVCLWKQQPEVGQMQAGHMA